MRFQKTIAGPAVCAGVGVHSGQHARLVLSPAPVGSGIVFARTDATVADNRVRAHADRTFSTQLGTTLRNDAGVSVATTEHLLAACMGLEVDNLLVEIDGPEVPILDGSAAPFVQLLRHTGLRTQHAPARLLRVLEPIEVRDGAKRAALLPQPDSDALELDVTIRFADPAIGVQRKRLVMSPEAFTQEIAEARTFGFMSEINELHARGLGRGASLSNVVAVENGRVLNPEGLRRPDEFVAHKLLDAVGDLALLSAAIAGRFVADQPGHALNAALVRAVLDTPQAWCWEEAGEAAVLALAGA